MLNDATMKSLGVFIKTSKYIKRIDLIRTSISDIGVEILAPYLDRNMQLEILHLADECIENLTNFLPFIVDMTKIEIMIIL